MKYQVGMFARSLAGHDKDTLYVIQKVEDRWLYLVDGKIRTVDKPKKKKKIHVQLICEADKDIAEKLSAGTIIQNEDIKRAIGGRIHV